MSEALRPPEDLPDELKIVWAGLEISIKNGGMTEEQARKVLGIEEDV